MIENKKISIICTVKNEENNISELVESLLAQTFSADEIIFIDGGSTDRTTSILNQYAERNPQIKLIEKKNTNIAKGRNIGISSSKNEIIAVTDAGTKPQKNWLENLIKKLDEKTDVVSGFYLPDARTKFESLVAKITFRRIENVNEKIFLPSSRSILFRKKCWKKVGGYPEDSLTAEDTLFDLNLLDAKFRFRFAKDAIVLWRCRHNLQELFKQWFYYGKGDGLLGIVMNKKSGRRHYIKILLEVYGFAALVAMGAFIDPILILIVSILGIAYFVGYYITKKDGIKIAKEHKDPSSLIMGPIILATIHIGQFFGIHSGFFGRKKLIRKKNSRSF